MPSGALEIAGDQYTWTRQFGTLPRVYALRGTRKIRNLEFVVRNDEMWSEFLQFSGDVGPSLLHLE
jgi:hypothetical protein